ncbi:Protein jagunal like [Schistosoma japonicum]|nr:Protein jagunal like [Schistosoma japonicum]
MASRIGHRPEGTDGADFRHRERVCTQYSQSPLLKRRIKFVYFLHLMLWVLMFARLLPEVCLRLGFRARLMVEKVMNAVYHNYLIVAFSSSIFPTLFGYISLQRSRAGLMRVSLTGTVVFGLGSVAVGCFTNAFELMDYYQNRVAKHYFFDFPVIVLFYIFFSLCVQVHGFSVFFGYKLYCIWSVKARKVR